MALTLLGEMVRSARDVEVVPVDWRENELAFPLAGRGVVLPTRLPFARTALWHLGLLRRLSSEGIAYDVVFDPTGYPDAFGDPRGLVLLVHDLSALRSGLYRPFKRMWHLAFAGRHYRRARLSICVSRYTDRELRRRFPMPVGHRAVVPNALALAPPPAGGREAPGGGEHFLFVGTLEERKNIGRILLAWEGARARGVRTPLVLVGKRGHLRAGTARRLDRLRPEGGVRVAGYVDEGTLSRLYAEAKAVVFPSLDEGFGLPILEAMGYGVPVITSSISAMPEVAGDAALLVDPLDVASIRDGIVRLDTEPDLRRTLAERGRARVRAFDPRAASERVVELLREVAGR